ncbi:carboxylesterase family protein [Pseudomonas duriflava]
MHSFKGIPFAKPPVGDLRWMPPVPVQAWKEPLVANKLGNTCGPDS